MASLAAGRRVLVPGPARLGDGGPQLRHPVAGRLAAAAPRPRRGDRARRRARPRRGARARRPMASPSASARAPSWPRRASCSPDRDADAHRARLGLDGRPVRAAVRHRGRHRRRLVRPSARHGARPARPSEQAGTEARDATVAPLAPAGLAEDLATRHARVTRGHARAGRLVPGRDPRPERHLPHRLHDDDVEDAQPADRGGADAPTGGCSCSPPTPRRTPPACASPAPTSASTSSSTRSAGQRLPDGRDPVRARTPPACSAR